MRKIFVILTVLLLLVSCFDRTEYAEGTEYHSELTAGTYMLDEPGRTLYLKIGSGSHEDGLTASLTVREGNSDEVTYTGTYRHEEIIRLQGIPNQKVKNADIHIDSFSFPEASEYSGRVEIRCGKGSENERNGYDEYLSPAEGSETYMSNAGDNPGNDLCSIYPWIRQD